LCYKKQHIIWYNFFRSIKRRVWHILQSNCHWWIISREDSSC